jgi:LysM repeat protein
MRKYTNIVIFISIVFLGGVFLFLPLSQPVQAQAVTATPSDQPGLASVVITSTTNPDGSVVHIIQYGETLIQIAQAYGVTLSQLFANNPDLDPQNPKYYEGETLIIVPPFTLTPNYSPTVTPRTPTVTPKPTRTIAPTRTAKPILTPTIFIPSPTPTKSFLEKLDINDRKVGYSIIAVSVVGLLAVAFWGFLKK